MVFTYKNIKLIFFITFLLNGAKTLAQKEAANWHFGLFTGLNFLNNPPTILPSSAMWSAEGSASISDPSGNILFYTDGWQLFNKQNVLMANGSGMNGNNTTTQSSIIIKQPGSTHLYFVFTLGPNFGDLKYSIVDMLLAAGDGSVISKNNLVATNCVEKLAATKHCNGTDVWVVAHKFNSQDFHAFLVTASGVNTTAVVSSIGSAHTNTVTPFLGSRGQMKISPSGQKLGVAIHFPDNKFELFDFDNTTGVVSNSLALGTYSNAYGCEFSSDGTKFYGATGSGPSFKILNQWDLCAGSGSAIIASHYTVAGTGLISGMQMAIDGKIYCSTQSKTMAVINDPNAAGPACNFVYNAVPLPTLCLDGVPNFMSSFFDPPPPPFTYTLIPALNCLAASFSPPFTSGPSTSNCAVGYSLIGTQWDFGDPSSGILNSSTFSSPTHTYSSFGTYTVQVILFYSCGGAPDTLRQTVNVVPPPTLNITLTSPTLCAQALNGSVNTITFTSSGSATTYTLATSAPALVAGNSYPTGTLTTTSPYTPSGISTATLYGTNGACTASLATTFSIIPNPTVSISSSTPVICVGKSYTYTSAGADSYTWTASTPNFTSYSNGGVAVTNPSINSVFTVFGTQLGCNSALRISSITVNPIPTVSINPINPIICKLSTFTLGASGSATDFTWAPNINITAIHGQSVQAQALENLTYTVVGSALGCTTSAFTSINLLALPIPTIQSSKPTFCVGDEITFKGFGGIIYDWSGPNGNYYHGSSITFTANSNSFAGDYTLTATDENSCKGNTVATVALNPLPNGSLLGKREGCAPLCEDFKFQARDEADFISSWTIDKQSYAEYFNHCFSQAGEYVIKGEIIDQSTKCKNNQDVKILVHEKPRSNFKWEPESPVELIDQVVFQNISEGHETNKSKWFMNQDNSFSSSQNNVSYTFLRAGNYVVVLLVENKWNCIDTAIKLIKVESDFIFYMPNAFTPNFDEKNESFKPSINGVRLYNLQVFNRWGERLFITEDPSQGWDGTYQSEACKQDVYIWKVILTTSSNTQKVFSGNVMLMR